MIRFLFKIWPALTPIVVYFLWVLIKKMINKNTNKKVIDATYFEEKANKNTQTFEKSNQNKEFTIGNFSLNNKKFIIVLYLSFFIAITCFLFFAIRVPKVENGNYIPAHTENGQIIPAKIIKKYK